ncbi:hypothetical protein [Aeromonas veronii]|uniref:hypothetical protein n=1 Tax=Aeromonas veronii TaxID=654 RepID=UPI000E1EC73A|nr:hypothetical protein [Aeromonas veronii]RDU80946.1 hypothetical protein CHF44_12965 [Aeromonas veronii]RDU88351.1 hypothetical protein CHH34_20550 [Aeromonas veronii]
MTKLTSFAKFQIMTTLLQNTFSGEYTSRDAVKHAAAERGITEQEFETVLADVIKAGRFSPHI